MARIRSVKPEFWTDPEVVACSIAARLFFIGTWNQADDYGVVKDDPAELKLKILPADAIDVHTLVDELVNRNMLLRKTAPDGTRVLVIRTFCLHQKIDTRSPGRWGLPEDFTDQERQLRALPAPDPNQSQPIPTNPVLGLEGTGLLTCASEVGTQEREPFADDFDRCWEIYPKRNGRKVGRKDAFRAYQARRRSGVTAETLLLATQRYASSTEAASGYAMDAKRFYGPNENWSEALTAPQPEQERSPWVAR